MVDASLYPSCDQTLPATMINLEQREKPEADEGQRRQSTRPQLERDGGGGSKTDGTILGSSSFAIGEHKHDLALSRPMHDAGIDDSLSRVVGRL